MNELISNVSTDVLMVWDNESDTDCVTHTVKRCSDSEQSVDSKRVKDNEYSFCSQELISRYDDLKDEEEDDEGYRELTEEEQMVLNISNKMINFSIHMQTIDWDEYYIDRPQESPPRRLKPIELPKTGTVLHGYLLETIISSNKRTAIYVGHKVKKPEGQVVIKVGFEMGFNSIENECNIYSKLKTSRSVPKLLDYLWWKSYREDNTSIRWGFIVLEKFGSNLVTLMNNSVLEETLVFNIAIQLVDAIEDFHENGFIHSSLTPEHILFESEGKPDLKLIGLSASKKYIEKLNNGTEKHIEDQKDKKLAKGNPYFHSIGYHNGFRRSRRDDMESLGYCLIFLVRGTLPWIDPSVKDLTTAKYIRRVGSLMQLTSIPELCKGLSPPFHKYFDLISTYKFNEKPDYESLRQCFRVNSV